MSTIQQPDVDGGRHAGASVEVKKFMDAESVDPAKGGLRVSVQPGGCSGFKYGLLIEDEPAEDDVVDRSGRLASVFVDPVLGAVPERRDHRLRVVDAGFRLHLQESELHWRLRVRQLVLRA